jgi:hypothetical protein
MATIDDLREMKLAYASLSDFVEWLVDVEYEDNFTELYEKFEKYQDSQDKN